MIHLRELFGVLRVNKLCEKLEKCNFMLLEVTFLGYIVTGDGIKVDSSKVEAIASWSIPKTITEVRAFHGLTSLYRRLIKNISTTSGEKRICCVSFAAVFLRRSIK